MKGLLATVKTRKLRYFGHVMHKSGDCLEKEAHYQEKEKKEDPRHLGMGT